MPIEAFSIQICCAPRNAVELFIQYLLVSHVYETQNVANNFIMTQVFGRKSLFKIMKLYCLPLSSRSVLIIQIYISNFVVCIIIIVSRRGKKEPKNEN